MNRRELLAGVGVGLIACGAGPAPEIARYSGLEIEIEGAVLIHRTPGAVLDFDGEKVVRHASVRYQFEGYCDLRTNARLLHSRALVLDQEHRAFSPAWYYDAACHELIIAPRGSLQMPGDRLRGVEPVGGMQDTDYWAVGRREDRRRRDVMQVQIDCVYQLSAPEV